MYITLVGSKPLVRCSYEVQHRFNNMYVGIELCIQLKRYVLSDTLKKS